MVGKSWIATRLPNEGKRELRFFRSWPQGPPFFLDRTIGLQAADIIANAIWQRYERDDHRLLDIFKDRIIIEGTPPNSAKIDASEKKRAFKRLGEV